MDLQQTFFFFFFVCVLVVASTCQNFLIFHSLIENFAFFFNIHVC
uniref:Uncharacterized protein n=1 Tax=Rhizophora mucronata TaxID=61149 RepID=A0A2P2NPR7_RHIMU